LGMDGSDSELLRVGYPLVVLGERIFGGPADHVTMQNVEAARAATEHLLALGRRRIAVIGAHQGEVIGSAGLRLRGYRQALAAAGIPFDPHLVVHSDAWFRADGARVMAEFLSTGLPFDAVFAFNDTLALGAMRVLQEAGLRIPEDVAVIGFDDLDDAKYSLPTLTTVNPGRDEIAQTAVEILLDRISGAPATAPAREIQSQFEIVHRESTGGTAIFA
ncbi:MAG TPA: substrate-binding domain-containing protein, partial [Glaciihabitans sp.]|nr:substrate-binding domain-containing protein [Glaciihabitans sp.]